MASYDGLTNDNLLCAVAGQHNKYLSKNQQNHSKSRTEAQHLNDERRGRIEVRNIILTRNRVYKNRDLYRCILQ